MRCPPPKTQLRKIACSRVPIRSGAVSHDLMLLKYTLYSRVCVSTTTSARYVVPTPENSAAKNGLISSTHWIGGY